MPSSHHPGPGPAFVAAALLALVACGPGGEDSTARSGGPTVRDSAGVEIVEHGALERAPVDSLGPPAWRHGTGVSDYPFQRIIDGVLRADGSVVVVDIGASEVVEISAGGASWAVLAGPGEGPAEVRMPVAVQWLGGDSLFVEDEGNAKLLVLAPGGDPESLGPVDLRETVTRLQTHARDRSGALLATTGRYMSDQGTGWIPGHMVRVNPETGRADTVAAYDLGISVPRDGPRDPFAPFGQASARADGFVYARSDRLKVEWRDPDGRLRRVVRWEAAPRYPDEGTRDAYLASMADDLRRVNPHMSADQLDVFIERQAERTSIDFDRPLPRFLPLVAAADQVWLGDFEVGGGRGMARGHTVIAQDGRSLRRVVFPVPVRLLDVAHGRALALETGELDVERIALYRLGG